MASIYAREGFRGDGSNSVIIQGADELITRLFAMWDKIGPRYLRSALNDAMAPMKSRLLANTPVGPTGNLRASVATKVRIYQTGTAFGIVGYQRAVSIRTSDNKGYHSHFLEFGTKERRPKRGPFLSSFKIKDWNPPGWRGRWPMRVRFVRPARPRHPMKQAYDATVSTCVATLEDRMARAVEKALQDGGGG